MSGINAPHEDFFADKTAVTFAVVSIASDSDPVTQYYIYVRRTASDSDPATQYYIYGRRRQATATRAPNAIYTDGDSKRQRPEHPTLYIRTADGKRPCHPVLYIRTATASDSDPVTQRYIYGRRTASDSDPVTQYYIYGRRTANDSDPVTQRYIYGRRRQATATPAPNAIYTDVCANVQMLNLTEQ